MPNKPMVPTAPASPAVNPPRLLRRYIGKPLDSRNERRMGERLECTPPAEEGGAASDIPYDPAW